MVTTRKDEVVSTMQISPTYQVFTHTLLRLFGDDSWKLFKQITFREDGVVENDNLEAMGRRMVERCGGLPLPIKALGGLLYSKKSEQDWLSIQNSETWLIEDVLPSLKLTYNNLPSSSLKHCFAYCVTFPKDFDIKKDKLIQIWMALGLFQPPRGSDLAMEDVGNEYFSTLLGNYLLQDVEEDAYGNIISCKMHDLVHDLALYSSKNYCKSLKASEVNHVSEAVHVWLKVAKDIKPKISKGSFERVQTLNLTGGGILGNMIPNLTNLTVLVLDSDHINKLPSSVGQLKYLRYLDIEFTEIEELPDSITKLYNLQTLRFGSLIKLPNKLGNLINIRHIHSSYIPSDMDHMFIELERLTCLQTLSFFVVGQDKKFRIENLGGLNNLKGGLCIYGLEEVTNMGDASKANLSKKSKIQHLKFHWKSVRHENYLLEHEEYNDEDVWEGLEPPAYLKELNIENFKRKKFASWMITESRSSVVLQNLVDIKLRNCNICERIPPLGHLPNLKSVCIDNMRNVKRIGKEFYGGHGDAKTISIMFPSLRKLTLGEEWMEADTVHDPSPWTKLFPCLEELDIWGCDNLMILPSHFPSLKTLRIHGINSVALDKICTKLNSLANLHLNSIKVGSLYVIPPFGHLPNLKFVYIHNMRNVKCIGKEFYGGHSDEKTISIMFPSLRKLTLQQMQKLEEWLEADTVHDPSPWTKLFSCLEELDIWGYDNLMILLSYFPSLKKLKIAGINSVALEKMCTKLNSLTDLVLDDIKGGSLELNPSIVAEFLGNNKSLRRLSLTYWDALLDFRNKLVVIENQQVSSCPDPSPSSISAPVSTSLIRLEILSLGPFLEELDHFPWPIYGFSSVSPLNYLRLNGRPKVKSLPEQLQHLSSLTRLELVGFDGLKALLDWLGILSSLRHLEFMGCQNLVKMPTLEAMKRLTNLKSLDILYCELLTKRCAEESGQNGTR